MPKPPPTPEQIKARTVEADLVPPVTDAELAEAEQQRERAFAAAAIAQAADAEATNPGYEVPPSPAIAAAPQRVLASSDARVHPPMMEPRPSPLAGVTEQRNAQDNRFIRNFADENYHGDSVDGSDQVLDLMQSNVVALQMVVPNDPGWFREFLAGERIEIGVDPVSGKPITKMQGQLDYEAFMHEPVVIRIHSTKDKNEPWVVFCGVNGDNRWLPRNTNIRLPRKHVERLAAAQEMAVRSLENKDPTVDDAMRQIKSHAASYEFSVLQDSQLGRRWLHRVTRQRT